MTTADNVLTEQSDVSVRKSRSLMQIKFRECKVTEAIPSAPQMVKGLDVDMKVESMSQRGKGVPEAAR